MSLTRRIVNTDQAPAAIGPYSQAVHATSLAHLIFCSGQIPLDPQTGEIVGGDDVEAQTVRVLDNLKAVLEEAHSGLEHVLRCEVFLADMNDFAVVNEVYARYFQDEPPARITVEVSRLPKDVKVEIAAIATR